MLYSVKAYFPYLLTFFFLFSGIIIIVVEFITASLLFMSSSIFKLCLPCGTFLSIRTIITFGDYHVNFLFYLDDRKIYIIYDLVSGRNTRLDLASITRVTCMCIFL